MPISSAQVPRGKACVWWWSSERAHLCSCSWELRFKIVCSKDWCDALSSLKSMYPSSCLRKLQRTDDLLRSFIISSPSIAQKVIYWPVSFLILLKNRYIVPMSTTYAETPINSAIAQQVWLMVSFSCYHHTNVHYMHKLLLIVSSFVSHACMVKIIAPKMALRM